MSGLLTCGCCGGQYGIITRDRYGCLNRYRRGTCDNGHTVRRDDIERRVLAGLTDKLVSADAVASAVRAFAEELNRQNHERRVQAEIDNRALAKIERGITGMMAAIEDMERQKTEILARLAEAPEDVPDVHPNIAEIYRARVLHLAEALADPELQMEAAEVVLTPGGKRGDMRALLRGELVGILDMATKFRRHRRPDVIMKRFACLRNQSKRRQS